MDETQGILNKPRQVRVAIAILYIAVALSLVRYSIDSIHYFLGVTMSAGVVALFVIWSMICFFCWGVAIVLIEITRRRHNWARITGLVLFLLLLPFLTLQKIHDFHYHPVSISIGVIQDVMDIVALVLLFQRDSSAWFRAQRASL